MAEIPAFLQFQVDAAGRLQNLHQSTRLVVDQAVWEGGLQVPVFWVAAFSRGDLHASGASIGGASALRNLERRRAAWEAHASERVFRGYPRFLEWMRRAAGGRVTLDVSGLDAWRHAPLLAAVDQLIAFLDGAVPAPGPLGADELFAWTKRRGKVRLEASHDVSWPDEVPLFAPHADELARVTVGHPPFRNGPWPERRFSADPWAPLPPEVDAALKARAALVTEALRAAPQDTPLEGSLGNREAVERTRAHLRERCVSFRKLAQHLADSAHAFATTHAVLDDTALWAAQLSLLEPWWRRVEDWLTQQEREVRQAMEAGPSSADPGRELDLDNFPSGDDPF